MIISIATENSSKTKTRTKQKELPYTWSMRSIQTLENVAHKYWSEQRWRSQPQEVRGKQRQEKQTYFSIILNCRIDWILCFTLNRTKKTEPVLSVHCIEETNSSKRTSFQLQQHCEMPTVYWFVLSFSLIVIHTCTKIELASFELEQRLQNSPLFLCKSKVQT